MRRSSDPIKDSISSEIKIQNDAKDELRLKQKKNLESFEELKSWFEKFQDPVINDIYSESKLQYLLYLEQIFKIREFIQLSQGIKLRRKSQLKNFYFLCENFDVCSYSLVFEIQKKVPKSLETFYKLINFQKNHPNLDNNHECFLPNDQIELSRRKKYLQLVGPFIMKIMTNKKHKMTNKSPNQILNCLCKQKRLRPNFLFDGLDKSLRRQLKKKFDNVIANTKKAINNSIQQNQRQSNLKNGFANKKRKIIKKSKSQRKSKQNDEKQKIEAQRPSIMFYEQQSVDQQEPLLDQIQQKEKFEMKSEEKQKQESFIYTTPTKKKNFIGFDLEKSSSKRRTQFVASYPNHSLSKSDEKKLKIEDFFDEMISENNKKQNLKQLVKRQNFGNKLYQLKFSENQQFCQLNNLLK